MHRPRRWLWWAVPLGILGVAVASFLIWAMTPLGPTDAALAALEDSGDVAVETKPWGVAFVPRSAEPSVGLVLYPGGRVDFRSYAPLARAIASRGYYVAVVKVPLSLAVLSPDAANGPIAEEPGVAKWATGGHSLGGVMAARYAADHASIGGLLMLASYPTAGADLSDRDIDVADLVGSNDGVLGRQAWEQARPLLPAATDTIELDGGNHAQFGDYGLQPGDGEGTMTTEEQQRLTAQAAASILAGLTKED